MDCATCEYRPPDIMPGNVDVVGIRQLTLNCVRYIAGMGGVVAIGFDWINIEALCRMSGIRLNRLLVEKLRVLENITIYYMNKKEGDTHG